LQAILALEDGRLFHGRAFGAVGQRSGEVVFNTAMTGYQEVLTDPSYRGQIVVMTCPEIGNYGTNGTDNESGRPQVEGFAVRELSPVASSWRASKDLEEFLRASGIPGISEIDTRALTRHLRSRGAMKGVLSSQDLDGPSLVRKAQESPGLEHQDLVGQVTCREPHVWQAPRDPRWGTALGLADLPRLRCVAYDFGIKRNILRLLHEAGFDVTVVPARAGAAQVRGLRPDAVFLSNGPGDPAAATYAIASVRELIGEVPIFGICLGHQIAALALGGKTFKLKFGHRGANHPVRDLRSGRIAITAQNHGYAVDGRSLPGGVHLTHVNLNDETLEGFVFPEARLLAVQYHPESSPGPHDAHNLFGEFRALAAGAPATPAPPAGRSDS
jgi:carbamoyl-phosphate synthase small subunit